MRNSRARQPSGNRRPSLFWGTDLRILREPRASLLTFRLSLTICPSVLPTPSSSSSSRRSIRSSSRKFETAKCSWRTCGIRRRTRQPSRKGEAAAEPRAGAGPEIHTSSRSASLGSRAPGTDLATPPMPFGSRFPRRRSAKLEKEVAGLREKIHHLDDMLKSQQRKVRQMIEQVGSGGREPEVIREGASGWGRTRG